VKIIDVTTENLIENSYCGYKNQKQEGYQSKVNWIADSLTHGLRHKLLINENNDAVGGIEYLPGEDAWRSVKAKDFLFIHCIYILKKDIKSQGYGKKLLDECLKDANVNGYNGVAALVRKGTWMAGKELFLSHGFEEIDAAKPDYTLVAKIIKESSAKPSIVDNKENLLKNYNKGLFIFTSGQCPYLGKAVPEIIGEAKKEFGIKATLIEMKSIKDVRENPVIYGTFGIVYNGEIIGDHPMSKAKFRNNLRKVLDKKK